MFGPHWWQFWNSFLAGVAVVVSISWLGFLSYDQRHHITDQAFDQFVYRSTDRCRIETLQDEYNVYVVTLTIMALLLGLLLLIQPRFLFQHWGGACFSLYFIILPIAFLDYRRRLLKTYRHQYD